MGVLLVSLAAKKALRVPQFETGEQALFVGRRTSTTKG